MKVLERNVMRLAVVQHLRATYNIKTKNWNKGKPNKLSTTQSVKVFGVSLEILPHCPLLDYGSVPCFLVDACTYLLEHANTEGLFRKSGSIVRLKALRAKLDQGEECLASALPVDIAALLKQFFRELPEPVLSTELHAALLKAQELPTEEERTSATMLLSCVLPERNLNTLRYFFSFLQSVSQRSAENKMDSSNLSVIFAPNLLHSAEGADKMNAATEKKLKLQAAVVHCFIQNAQNFGVVPQFLQDKVPAMLGGEAGLFSPPLDLADEHSSSSSSGLRRSHRRSLGDLVNGALNKLLVNRTPTNTPKSEEMVFSSATPVIMTPSTKRKLPLDSGQTESSNKKRRSIKKNLGIELFPHALFGASSTPGSVHSASGVSPSVVSTGRSTRLTASSARRKSKRLSYRTHQINRHESGKTGCFSPRVPKKEAARKSLRLRFSLGKGIKDSTFGSQSLGAAKGSETIGWRLATQDSTTSFHFATEPHSSPAVVLRNKHASTKYISKSEDNLLSPQRGPEDHRTSWNGETPDVSQPSPHDSFPDTPMNVCLKNNYFSEPAIVTAAKPPSACGLPKTLCCATSAESLDSTIAEDNAATGPTLLKIKRAFGESGTDLHTVVKECSAPCGQEEAGAAERSSGSQAQASGPKDSEETLESEVCSGVLVTPAHKCVLDEQNVTFGQIEIVPLSPLHIDSALFECRGWDSREPSRVSLDMSTRAVYGSCDDLDEADEIPGVANCSQLVDALDIQSPVVFRLSSMGCQSTPHRAQPELSHRVSLIQEETSECSEPPQETLEPTSEPSPSKPGKAGPAIKVADQIQRFNMLTIKSPQVKRVRSPIKFQRTPVRQSVRRINSLLGNSQKPGAQSGSLTKAGPMLKATSLDAGLSAMAPPKSTNSTQPNALVTKVPSISKTRPPVPPKRVSIRNSSCIPALGDVTNKVPQRLKGDVPQAVRSEASEPAQKSAVQLLAQKETTHYRGSPRNPLNGGRLLPAAKPIDL